jgi:hypothetical protein
MPTTGLLIKRDSTRPLNRKGARPGEVVDNLKATLW